MTPTVDVSCDTAEQLHELLRAHRVPLRRWGRGGAKTVSQLLEEMRTGESRLTISDGRLLRTVDVVNVVVEHGDLRLVEEEIRLPGGITRRRRFPWVSEKLVGGEPVLQAARRALAEELGIDDPQLQCRTVLERCTDASSGAYPGLACRFQVHQVSCQLPDEHFVAGGYVEDDGVKQVVFRWRPRSQASLKVRTSAPAKPRRRRPRRTAEAA